MDYKSWHDLHFSPACLSALSVNTGSMLQRYIEDDSWRIAPMLVINGAMRSNPNLTYYNLTTPPPPRICYTIKNLYPNTNNLKLIEEVEAELDKFIASDDNICSFESWMLNK